MQCNQQNPCAEPPRERRAALRATQQLYRTLGAPVLASGLVLRERGPRGELLLRRAPGTGPAAVVRAAAGALRGAPAHTGAVAARGGWTAPRVDDGDREAVAARIAPLLCAMGAAGCSAARGGADAALRALEALGEGTSARGGGGGGAALPPPIQPTAIAASITPFEYAGAAIAAGDFNGDGLADFAVTAYGHC